MEKEELSRILVNLGWTEADAARKVLDRIDWSMYQAEHGISKDIEDAFYCRKFWGDGKILLVMADIFLQNKQESDFVNDPEFWNNSDEVRRVKSAYEDLKSSKELLGVEEYYDSPEQLYGRIMYRALTEMYKNVQSTYLASLLREKLEAGENI